MPKITKIDVSNNVEEVREMNTEELAEYNELVEYVAIKKAKEKAEREAAESALLESLGITKEQAIVLGLLQPDYVKPNFA
jgi:DNA-binding protein H-NS